MQTQVRCFCSICTALISDLLARLHIQISTPFCVVLRNPQHGMERASLRPVVSGGGNVLNVQRTIKQFIAAGAKGCTLEDQKWPKKSGSVRGKEVIGMDEHIAKVSDSDPSVIVQTRLH